MSKKDIVQTSNIVADHRIIAKATLVITGRPYFTIRLDFPDGTWRVLYVSTKVLDGEVELDTPSDREVLGYDR